MTLKPSAELGEMPTRGVYLHDVTRRWYLLRTSKPSDESYRLSKPVESLDEFLSHSWSGSPFWKHMTLVTVLYVKFGYIAMLLTVIPLSVGIYFLPAYKREAVVATEVLGVFAMFLGMWFGYLIPSRTNKKMVFLDKCCIPQVDEKAKREGLKNMEAYLNRSDTLLILWTPEYFSRLWCVFEYANFLHIHNVSSIRCYSILTSRLAHLIAMVEILGLLVIEVLYIPTPCEELMKSWTPPIVFFLFEVFMSVGVCLIVLLYFVPAKLALKKQVQRFSVDEAECTFSEDTEMLRLRINEWYGSDRSFNDCVRNSWSCMRSMMRKREDALPREVAGVVMFPYILVFWPRLAASLSSFSLEVDLGYSWYIILRDTITVSILLMCRTPLFTVASYRLVRAFGSETFLGRSIILLIILLLGISYGALMFVSGQAAFFLFDSPTVLLFAVRPCAWIMVVLPFITLGLLKWTHFSA
ncbi:hypothetical protein FOL47_010494 [Perkinsus chesapeaki]|uniref:Uncharacterized protein n=2 Tax=Alveolata TaxID=33630 RepID=A0A7J6L2T5_PERCH|nr:hypothetical protein FOL47_010494 [Perkinsus chesapeaki]